MIVKISNRKRPEPDVTIENVYLIEFIELRGAKYYCLNCIEKRETKKVYFINSIYRIVRVENK